MYCINNKTLILKDTLKYNDWRKTMKKNLFIIIVLLVIIICIFGSGSIGIFL